MNEDLLIGIAAIALIGTLSQWIAWRLHLPTILLLLLTGLAVGPLYAAFGPTGQPLLNPDVLFGDSLMTAVSIAVGIILFEGGLTLNLRELRASGSAVRNLISIGALTTGVVCGLGAFHILGFGWELSMLFGSLLIVTGPTVILPLLRQARLRGESGKVLKWEGILNDPVGAILAVLVFEAVLLGGSGAPPLNMLKGLAVSAVSATVISWTGAFLLITVMRRHWAPDFLHVPLTITTVILVFSASNLIQHESGLLSATLLGMFLGNQRKVPVGHIAEFKEHLRVLFISALFIVLAARIELAELRTIDWRSLAFLAFVILVARPLAVFISSIGTGLSLRDQLMVGWMAPRGIVAAAVTSVFALELTAREIPDAGRLLPEMLVIIVGTVTVYGLTSRPVARLLKLTNTNPGGILLVGAHTWARRFGKAIAEAGGQVKIVDNNRANVLIARDEGLNAFAANVVKEEFVDEVDLTVTGHVAAITQNDEVNMLVCAHLLEEMERSQVYQLVPRHQLENEEDASNKNFQGRYLFGKGVSFDRIERATREGAAFGIVELKPGETWASKTEEAAGNKVRLTPLCEVTSQGRIALVTQGSSFEPRPGSRIVYLERRSEPSPEPVTVSDADPNAP